MLFLTKEELAIERKERNIVINFSRREKRGLIFLARSRRRTFYKYIP